ncbi:20S proteasome subunit alpha 2 [Nematocida sp. AWRm78]|nr:20S proteasome subunit alpha 2 [Nematocida sp. AWRm79]KAI5184063.1 20S proteasome subunit alpha 2 [Nematocida sp. AWRm78]
MHEEVNYSTTTFSSKGILSHCERALTAGKNGALSVGIRGTNGIVLASIKKVPSTLVEIESIQKVFMVCDTIICTYSGLSGDFRLALEMGRKIASDYYRIYGRYPYIDTFMKEFSKVLQEKTQRERRPIGCICLFAGYTQSNKYIQDAMASIQENELNEDTLVCDVSGGNGIGNTVPLLYQIDPSGSVSSGFSFAVGKMYKESSDFLKKRCSVDVEVHDAVVISALALQEYSEVSVSAKEISISVVTQEGIQEYTQEEVQNILHSI